MRTQLLAAAAALTITLTGAASASATTFNASPGSTRAQAPCTVDQPCKLSFAVGQAFSGDDIALAPGTYDYFGTDPLEVRPGVTLHGAPGRVRPLIEQTAPYRDCDNCPILEIRDGSVLRDVDVTQGVEGGGAVKATPQATIERSALRGRGVALGLRPGTGSSEGSIRDVLAVAETGTAIAARYGGVHYLENVTAIGRGGGGTGISVISDAGTDQTVDAVNTITRGDLYDAQVVANPAGAGIDDVATLKLRYSNFRQDKLYAQESDPAWSNARIEGFDHNQHGDPQFASATDFRLAQTSPAVDNGRASGLLGAFDLDGLPRTIGPKPDIGAYEWHPTPAPDNGGGQPGDQQPDNGGGNSGGEQQQPGQPDQPKQPEQPQQPDGPKAAGLAIAKQTVTVKKNVAAVKVTCPAAASAGCKGTLSLMSGKVKVGSARYSLKAGKAGVVNVKLARAARKLIARKRKLKATATATDANAAITLKLPARKR